MVWFITREYIWYYVSGVKFGNLPSDSFTSPDFLRFALIQDIVWMNFSISDLKFNFMGKLNGNDQNFLLSNANYQMLTL